MARERLADHNVVATFSDMENARKAIMALERAGIDADNISLLGRAGEEVANETDPAERDAGVTKDVTKAALTGTAVGGAVGGIAGFIAGALAFGIPGIGPVVGSGIWAATLGAAGVGGPIGGLVAGAAALGESEAWESTYHESVRSGRVVIAVHADDRQQLDQAADILRGQEPAALDFLNAQGRRVDAA